MEGGEFRLSGGGKVSPAGVHQAQPATETEWLLRKQKQKQSRKRRPKLQHRPPGKNNQLHKYMNNELLVIKSMEDIKHSAAT